MKGRNYVSAFFVLAYGVAMALLGYLGRHNFVHTEVMILVTLIAAFMAVVFFWGLWNLDIRRRDEAALQTGEKRKRESLDAVLRDMSSSDLEALKRRLMDAEPENGVVEEEGELLKGKRQ